MKEDFTVTIKARGEGLDYRDADGLLRFEIGRSGSTVQLHAYDPRSETFQPVRMSDEQEHRIIPRIVAYLERDGSRAQVLSAALPPPPRPLRSVDDIMQERFRRQNQRNAKAK